MRSEYIKVLAILVAAISMGMSIFQLLLAWGLPLGDYAWGGKYKIFVIKKDTSLSMCKQEESILVAQ